MGYTWFREINGGTSYDRGSAWLCAIPAGSTYRRVRWSWGFSGDTATTVDMAAMRLNILTAGMVTTIGNGGETVPNPLTAPNDAAPPTQRWVWWEARQPIVSAIDQAAGVVAWQDSGAQEIPDVKVNVLATGIPGGDTLNLWFTWAAVTGVWDPSGAVQIWVATSVLFSTP